LRKDLLQIIFVRTIEMLLGCILPSVFICALCVSGPMPLGSQQRDITLIAAPVLYMVWNVAMLRRCYAFLQSKEHYYIVNCIAYAAFALINIGAYLLLPTDGYTWLFVVTRFLRYSNLGISSPVGIALFHVIIGISIFISPIGMDWVYEENKRRQQYIESMPPMLEINPLEEKPKNTEEQHEKENQEKTENNMSEL